MPLKGSRGTIHHRSGPQHAKHKPTPKYLQPYWPYIPLVVIVIVGLFFGSYRPQAKSINGVLAYATNTTAGGLLAATNAQRSGNGEAGLSLNSQLNSAAQAKANDMVARNYWSHTTPDGQQPWVFVSNAGYKYTKAGENLAYGFTTSDETISGWMNSAPHRANILDAGYKEVGFGIANSPNFVGYGPETVVVAMYGTPQVLGANSSAASPSGSSSSSSSKNVASKPTATPAVPTTAAPTTPTESSPAPVEEAKKEEPKPVTTATPVQAEPASLAIARGQAVTGGKTPWIVSVTGLLASLAVIALLLRHGVQLKHVLRKSERFALKHPVFDTAMVSAIMIAYVLSGTTGFIR